MIRNTLHNNGFHQSLKPVQFSMLGEIFILKEKMPPDFISLELVIKWVEEMIKIFVGITLKTNYKEIPDNTIRSKS